jgi:hypothetical protein
VSVAIRSPRRSALGVTWCEDFSRGRLGVVKNQGVITEVAPNVIGFDGRWARFPNNVAARLAYPHVNVQAQTSITFGCRVSSLGSSVGAVQALMGQQNPGATAGFTFYVNQAVTSIRSDIVISGLNRAVLFSPTTITKETSVIVTWTSGDYIRMIVNGELAALSGATFAGSITDDGTLPLYVGSFNATLYPVNGSISEPFIARRAFSASEARAWHNRSLF